MSWPAQRQDRLKQERRLLTIRLDEQTIHYFKAIALECGIAYQTLINLYLRDCAASGKRLALNWKSVA